MILARIDRFLRASKMTPSRFGRDVLGDPKFVYQLRSGREPRQHTIDRVTAWIDSQEEPK